MTEKRRDVPANQPEADVAKARELIEQGRPFDAEAILKRWLAEFPEDPDALCCLGMAYHDQKRLTEGVDVLLQAIAINASNADAHFATGSCYNELLDYPSAIQHFELCLEANPSHIKARVFLALALDQTYQFEAGAAHAKAILGQIPNHVPASIILARCLRHMGQPEEALAVLENLYVTGANINQMGVAPGLLQNCDIERAHCYLENQDYVSAFRYFDKSNAAIRAANPNWSDLHTAYQREIWMQRRAIDLVAARPAAGTPSRTPLFAKPQVFVAGFPRSGTTLLRSVLASHPDLAVAQEISALEKACFSIPGGLGSAPTPEHVLHQVRETYYANINALNLKKPYRVLVDIHPSNTRLVAWMAEVFPHAKLILMVRHPCDVCLSAYMQNFGLNSLTAGMLTLEDTVQTYVQVMSLWNDAVKALSLDVLMVRYEDIVADLNPAITRVLNHIGVDWASEIEEFSATAKADRPKTASAHQVIKPLYGHASYRWKQCRDIIEPHFEALAPFIESYGYNLD